MRLARNRLWVSVVANERPPSPAHQKRSAEKVICQPSRFTRRRYQAAGMIYSGNGLAEGAGFASSDQQPPDAQDASTPARRERAGIPPEHRGNICQRCVSREPVELLKPSSQGRVIVDDGLAE